MFKDRYGKEITKGIYKKKRDERSIYSFEGQTSGQVGLSPDAPYWQVKQLSAHPFEFEELQVLRSDSKNYYPIPEEEVEGRLFTMLLSAFYEIQSNKSKLSKARRKLEELSDCID